MVLRFQSDRTMSKRSQKSQIAVKLRILGRSSCQTGFCETNKHRDHFFSPHGGIRCSWMCAGWVMMFLRLENSLWSPWGGSESEVFLHRWNFEFLTALDGIYRESVQTRILPNINKTLLMATKAFSHKTVARMVYNVCFPFKIANFIEFLSVFQISRRRRATTAFLGRMVARNTSSRPV